MSGSSWYGSSIRCCATSIRKIYSGCAFSSMYKKKRRRSRYITLWWPSKVGGARATRFRPMVDQKKRGTVCIPAGTNLWQYVRAHRPPTGRGKRHKRALIAADLHSVRTARDAAETCCFIFFSWGIYCVCVFAVLYPAASLLVLALRGSPACTSSRRLAPFSLLLLCILKKKKSPSSLLRRRRHRGWRTVGSPPLLPLILHHDPRQTRYIIYRILERVHHKRCSGG